MTLLSILRQVTRMKGISIAQNSLSVSCTLCYGFNHSAWISTSTRVKAPLTPPAYALENGLRSGRNSQAIMLNYQPRRNAGHSKWANIKHVKQANDMARAREITKYINFIKVVVREHGSADPKQNAKLAQIIAQIKEAKLPMASIDRALQNMQSKKDSQNCILPIKGPGNCVMLCDLESSNLMRTRQELNTVLKKNKAIVTEESVLYMFEHKGSLFCEELDGKPLSEELMDEATAHAIDAGANDVVYHEDHPEFGKVFEFITEPSAFFKVKGALESLKYSITHAEVGYVPKNYIELSDEDVDAANKLYTKLTDHPDVQKIYVNIA